MNNMIERQPQVLVVAVLMTVCLVSACNNDNVEELSKEIQIMSDAPTSSRPPPPEVEAIVHDGVRYEEDKVSAEDNDQNGGYLAAFDAETGEKLWRLKVYEVTDYSDDGIDNIGLHFASMRLWAEQGQIEIVNESGSRYRFNLAEKITTYIDGPAAESGDEAEADTRPPPPSE